MAKPDKLHPAQRHVQQLACYDDECDKQNHANSSHNDPNDSWTRLLFDQLLWEELEVRQSLSLPDYALGDLEWRRVVELIPLPCLV